MLFGSVFDMFYVQDKVKHIGVTNIKDVSYILRFDFVKIVLRMYLTYRNLEGCARVSVCA